MSSILSDPEKSLLNAVGRLIFTNPFTPERLRLEEQLLGHKRPESVWNMHSLGTEYDHDIDALAGLAEHWSNELRRRAAAATKLSPSDCEILEAVVLYHLFEKYREPMTEGMLNRPESTFFPVYRDFERDFNHYLLLPGRKGECPYRPERTFAIYFQIHRAFYHIFDFIAGSTIAAGEFRASIWQSIFTCDIYRYHRALYNRMNQITTLISGESGTGKELVASAIARSQYIPFDPGKMEFAVAYSGCFWPVQLSAMPQTMLESELFGHRKGAYTGALGDRKGYLESCPEWGSVFLDEIGDINMETQVKLLRVLQTRHFQRLGDTAQYMFKGKIIAATNRDLGRECANGKFREDLYYRLCADTISTPSLRELIGGGREELNRFVHILSVRCIGEDEAAVFTGETVRWIEKNLGLDYPWPGNVRELEQCVRNLLIRGRYTPASIAAGTGNNVPDDIPAAELMTRYCRALYRRFGNYRAAADFAGLDRRTLRKYIGEDGD